MAQTFDDIVVTGSITVKHPDAPHGLAIVATKTGAGIWVGDSGTFVAIHNVNGQCCLVVEGGKSGGHSYDSGHTLALGVNQDGEPFLQLHRPGEGKRTLFLDGDRLEALFKGE